MSTFSSHFFLSIILLKLVKEFFSFELPRHQLAKRVVKFESKVNTV